MQFFSRRVWKFTNSNLSKCLFQLNIGIPSLTKCCNQHDRCYETCGKSKNDCDEEFQYCLSKICRDVQRTLGLAQHVQGEGTGGAGLSAICQALWGEERAMVCSCPTVTALSYSAACETTVELLFDSVIHLGCKPYLDSQRAACTCRYQEKTDL
ncbi:hypothetical protein HPG69_016297 [Diceros bicornis minor]|uniref:Group XIIA secretory phospholipase A2 n=1 Tax=Diceros bicornis minor TaxID=77932 RepID=A0A7J7F706_DICBM|nr:hypothetical protein HPG69_016297 [Diceros bicornis minor]